MSDKLREALERAHARRLEAHPETSGLLPELDEPEHWPHRFCTYQEARGFVYRMRASDSRERKAIAKEHGVTPKTISEAVKNTLLHVGDYDPEGWLRRNRELKAEGRRAYLAMMRDNERRQKAQIQELTRNRDAVAEQRRVMELEQEEARLNVPHVSVRATRESATRSSIREKQRRLDAKNRAALRYIN